ncbi:hypothetical protein [Devosia sp. DBB001]|nr:hypothetical protein [Devosia sp. DBB001]
MDQRHAPARRRNSCRHFALRRRAMGRIAGLGLSGGETRLRRQGGAGG